MDAVPAETVRNRERAQAATGATQGGTTRKTGQAADANAGAAIDIDEDARTAGVGGVPYAVAEDVVTITHSNSQSFSRFSLSWCSCSVSRQNRHVRKLLKAEGKAQTAYTQHTYIHTTYIRQSP